LHEGGIKVWIDGRRKEKGKVPKSQGGGGTTGDKKERKGIKFIRLENLERGNEKSSRVHKRGKKYQGVKRRQARGRRAQILLNKMGKGRLEGKLPSKRHRKGKRRVDKEWLAKESQRRRKTGGTDRPSNNEILLGGR